MKSLATGLSFRLPRLKCIPRNFERYIHGEWIDRNPLPVETEFQDNRLHVSHNYKESLRIIVPWEIEGLGVFFLKTVSLPKSDQPYDLVLELARGTVGRLVDQTENWKAGGLNLSGELENQLSLVKRNFQRATFCSGDERFQFAMVAIGASIHLMNQVGSWFAQFVFEYRKQEKQPNTALLGAPYYETDESSLTPYSQIFNASLIDVNSLVQPSENIDSTLEVCDRLHKQGLTSCSAPMIKFREFETTEFESIDTAEEWMLNECTRQLDLGLRKCKLLMPVSNLGYRRPAGWNDQEQIHLTYELFVDLKSQLPQTPLVVGIDQPFGESQINGTGKTPLQLADNLIRMETPIAAFCLEINLGYYPDGTWIRDLFAFNDLLDSWAQFDYPLVVQLRIPGGVQSREDIEGDHYVAAGYDSQASWLEKIAMLAIAKQNVAGVFYAQVFDQPEDNFFGAGLISTQKHEKPAMDAIRRVRQSMA